MKIFGCLFDQFNGHLKKFNYFNTKSANLLLSKKISAKKSEIVNIKCNVKSLACVPPDYLNKQVINELEL